VAVAAEVEQQRRHQHLRMFPQLLMPVQTNPLMNKLLLLYQAVVQTVMGV
jgi:hypothetical protein